MTVEPITIHFEYFSKVPEGNYVAWIDSEKFKGYSVTGDSIGECVKELGISLQVDEMYKKQIGAKSER